jgi:hypothetical protein
MRSATVLLLAVVMVSCQSRPLSDVGTPLPTETAPALARTPRPPSVGASDGGAPVGEDARATPQPATATVVSSALVSPAPTKDSGYGFKRARVEGERPIPPAGTSPVTGAVNSGANAGSTPAPSATPIVRASSQAPTAGLEAEVWAAVQVYFPASEWANAMAVSSCETGGTFNPGAIGAHGEEGVFQVRGIYHGSVPSDIAGQVQQAARIQSEQGWGPWSCS